MTERERVVQILRALDLPSGQYVVSGSAVMILHGIPRRKSMGDLDLFVATRLWFDLLDRRYPPAYGGRLPPAWDVFTTDPSDPACRSDPPYLLREIHGLEVNIFHGWRRRGIGDIDVAFWIRNSVDVEGWPCLPLTFLYQWKLEMGRAKDVDDLQAIQSYLGVRDG